MTPQDLRLFRQNAGLRQDELAELLDISPRAYQDLEKPTGKVRHVYELAVLGLSLRLAVERDDPSVARPEAVLLAHSLAKILKPGDLARADFAEDPFPLPDEEAAILTHEEMTGVKLTRDERREYIKLLRLNKAAN